MENHDEQRRAEVFPNQRLAADGTLLATLPGIRFYHQASSKAAEFTCPITLRIAADEPPDPVSTNFFQKILQITRQDVFHEGEWNLLDVAPEGDAPPDGLLVYEWRSPEAWKIIAVNLADYTSQGRIPLGDRVSPAQNYILNDELNNVRYDRTGAELHNIGLFIRLPAFQAHLFDLTPVQ